MYKYEISIIIPGIRVSRWQDVYNSATRSCNGKSFEMIFVGPEEPSASFLTLENVIFVKDFGSPNRCQQIAASKATGKYLTWIADDANLIDNTLSTVIDFLDIRDDMNAVCCKFLEGDNPSPDMWSDAYYFVNNSTWTRAPFISNSQLIMNAGVVHTRVFRDIGGFDTELFETTAMSHSDFAIRLSHHGVKIHLLNLIFAHCGFMPGIVGDHGPVFTAHHDSDIPNFVNLYSSSNSLNRCKIDIDNYKITSSCWTRRFQTEKEN